MNKIIVKCPDCGYKPTSPLHLRLSMSNYVLFGSTKNKVRIKCNTFMCRFEGTAIEWLKIK